MTERQGRLVHRRTDLAQTRLHRLQTDGEKAHQIGKHQGEQAAAEQQPRRYTEPVSHARIQGIVEGRQRDHHAHRDDGSRHRVAQRRETRRKMQVARRQQTLAVSEQQGQQQGEQGGNARQQQAVPDQAQEGGIDHFLPGQPRPVAQQQGGHDKAQQHRQGAGHKGGNRPYPAQRVFRQAAVAPAGVMIAGLPPGQPLQQHQGENEQQQQRRKSRRGQRIAHAEPGTKDAGGEYRQTEIGHGAVVGQGFHQGQRQARNQRRPRQRQGHAKETAPGAATQGPAHLEHADGLFEKGGPRQQIDIGIEHQGQHHDGAAERADLGKGIVAVAPAGPFPQQGLHRPGEIQQAGITVGDDVGRYGQRHQQGPGEKPLAGKPAHGRQPGRGNADQQHAKPYAQGQPGGIDQVFRQHGLLQMLPVVAGRFQQVGRYGQNRQTHGQGQQQQAGAQQAPAQSHGRATTGIHWFRSVIGKKIPAPVPSASRLGP